MRTIGDALVVDNWERRGVITRDEREFLVRLKSRCCDGAPPTSMQLKEWRRINLKIATHGVPA